MPCIPVHGDWDTRLFLEGHAPHAFPLGYDFGQKRNALANSGMTIRKVKAVPEAVHKIGSCQRNWPGNGMLNKHRGRRLENGGWQVNPLSLFLQTILPQPSEKSETARTAPLLTTAQAAGHAPAGTCCTAGNAGCQRSRDRR